MLTMAKRVFAVLVMVLIAAVPAAADSTDSAPLELYFFGASTCGQCMEIKETLLQPLEKELGGRLSVQYHEIDNSMALALLLSMEEQRGKKTNEAQVLFFPDTILSGFESIMANARAVVEEYLNDPQRRMSIDAEVPDSARARELIEKKFSDVTLWLVITLAIIDSLNPCAIATMIFLISFLTVQKRRRIEILLTGMTFALAVFITYFLIMLGAFAGISQISQFRWVSLVIKWSAVVLAGGVGIISLIDALRFKKSGDTKDIKLQLPKAVKIRIHNIISKNMKGKRLIIGTFVTGFLVTLLEAICTGQTLMPTVVAMTQGGLGLVHLTAWLYLILYCFIFVVPLIAVMIAAYYGMKWNQLAQMTQKNLTLLKIIVGIVMLGLALYLALALT